MSGAAIDARNRSSHTYDSRLGPRSLDYFVLDRQREKDQVDIVICSSTPDKSARLEKLLVALDDWNVIGRTDSADDLVGIIRREQVDVSLVTGDSLEIGLGARRQIVSSPNFSPFWIAHLESESLVQVVKAVQFGFNDVISGPVTSESLRQDLSDIVARRRSVVTDPVLSEVDLVPGLYSRTIDYRDELDRDLCEIVSLGIEDRAAAFVLDVTIQEIRNRIAALLERSGLSTRTQLATLHIRSRTIVRDGR